MKTTSFKLIAFLLIVAIFAGGCGDDDDPQDIPSVFIGDYVITKAKTTEAITLTTNEIGEIPIPAETDITEMIHAALLSQVTCTPEKTFIELRADNSMYFSCDGADALNAGTWEEVSATELKLNMNSTALPTSPSGATLTISNIVMAGNIMSGTTSVLLPKDMLQGILTAMTAQAPGGPYTLVDATPAALPVAFEIQITKQ